MKFLIGLGLLIAVIAFQSLNAVKICVINVNGCKGNATVCGRYGKSNLCRKFKNNCDLQSANCMDNVGYTAVIASRCNGFALNRRTTCSGLSSTSTGGGIWSSLFGGSSNYNVQPIIINTGK